MKIIGILINPIAGMGGKVGLKGTDSPEILQESIDRGATPIADKRVLRFLKVLLQYPEINDLIFLVPQGIMGEKIFKKTNKNHSKLNWQIIKEISIPNHTNKKETYTIAKFFKEKKVDLLLFVGGDGTARDILKVVGSDFPILGIPSGVKVHSGVFTQGIEKAASIIIKFIHDEIEFVHSEIVDLDEKEFRRDRIVTKIYGLGLAPQAPSLMQLSKISGLYINSDTENLEGIIKTFAKTIDPETLYLLGSGSTIKKLAKAFDNTVYEQKTQLGIDAVQNFIIIQKDVNESDILELLKNNKSHKVKIVLSPIGRQGFILGRGNQQFSPSVIKKVGIVNIIVVATLSKLGNLPDTLLHVDTGDLNLDKMFQGYIKVLVDYDKYQMVMIN